MKEEQQNQQQHHHQYEGGDHMADLRQFFTTAPSHNLPPPPTPHQPLFSSFAPLSHPYDVTMMLAMGAARPDLHSFRPTSTPTATTTSVAAAAAGFDVEAGGGDGGLGVGVGGGDNGATARWPRQETLTLLEIRSRLDPKFKEANHKGPLWDEVSRIMYEENGFQRSGKKCREKFENLYKYYKKTKDGKAGRHDGKHYRFFRQLEALYGESTHTTTHHHLQMINGNNITKTPIHVATPHEGQCNISNQDGFQSISLSNYSSSDFDLSSSDEKIGSTEKGESSMEVAGRSTNKRGKRSWKEKIKEFIDSQMRRIMEKQEAWLENMVRTIEHKEQERESREEEWRKQESMRMEREHKLWAEERAWIEARDKSLMDALQRVVNGKEVVVMEKGLSSDDHSEELLMAAACHDHDLKNQKSQEEEESNGGKWDCISEVAVEKGKANNNEDCSKKRKVNWRSKPINCNFQTSEDFPNNLYKYGDQVNSQGGMELAPQEKSLGGGNLMNESCLRMLIGDHGGENHLWDQSYGVKLNNKGWVGRSAETVVVGVVVAVVVPLTLIGVTEWYFNY